MLIPILLAVAYQTLQRGCLKRYTNNRLHNLCVTIGRPYIWRQECLIQYSE